MIPFSFIFRRVSDEWLVSRTASILFSVSCVSLLVVTPIWFGSAKIPDTTLWGNILLGILGVAGAFGLFFLWGGMWHYWLRVDASTQGVKRLWFFVLLIGLWYGSVLYFLLKYLLRDRAGWGGLPGEGTE